MASPDLIRLSLEAPIDWAKFEDVVCEILAQDDLPGLRQLGGIADEGRDAEEESFYERSQPANTVVQITSQQAQKSKVSQTIRRLKACGHSPSLIVMVFRDPVQSPIRTEMIQAANKKGFSLDVRDRSYLVQQLGRLDTGIYTRHFQGVREQVDRLLSTKDPLKIATEREKRAVLASVATYLLKDRSGELQAELFDRTVLAALASHGSQMVVSELRGAVKRLLGQQKAIHVDRIERSLERLKAKGLCQLANGTAQVSEEALSEFAIVLRSVERAYEVLVRDVVASGQRKHRLSDAATGRLEVNVRRALASVVRMSGPTLDPGKDAQETIAQEERSILDTLAHRTSVPVARTALAELADAISNPANEPFLAMMARSYAALAARNADPLGQSWQKTILSSKVLVLDTDVVLAVLIEELPEHQPMLDALSSFSSAGIRLMIPAQIIQEAAGHVGRAPKTYQRLGKRLHRLPVNAVDAEVWHAVVKGYYFHSAGSGAAEFHEYLQKYLDRKDPEGFVRHRLRSKISFMESDLSVIDPDECSGFWELFEAVYDRKESRRRKAVFRDLDGMKRRTTTDVKCALFAAETGSSGGRPNGYLVSQDGAFGVLQRHRAWGMRPRVFVRSAGLPFMAELICGIRLQDDDVVQMIFSPVLSAAAESLKSEINALTTVGASLRSHDFSRLDWDLRNGLEEAIADYGTCQGGAEPFAARMKLMEDASSAGYELEPELQEVVDEYRQTAADLKEQRVARTEAERRAKRLIEAASGLSKKGRRRVNRVLREEAEASPEVPED